MDLDTTMAFEPIRPNSRPKRPLDVEEAESNQSISQSETTPQNQSKTPHTQVQKHATRNAPKPNQVNWKTDFNTVFKSKEPIDQSKLGKVMNHIGLKIERFSIASAGKTWKIKFSNGIAGFNKAFSSNTTISEMLGQEVSIEAFQADYKPPQVEKQAMFETHAILRVRHDIQDDFILSELKPQFEKKVLKASRIVNFETKKPSRTHTMHRQRDSTTYHSQWRLH